MWFVVSGLRVRPKKVKQKGNGRSGSSLRIRICSLLTKLCSKWLCQIEVFAKFSACEGYPNVDDEQTTVDFMIAGIRGNPICIPILGHTLTNKLHTIKDFKRNFKDLFYINLRHNRFNNRQPFLATTDLRNGNSPGTSCHNNHIFVTDVVRHRSDAS